MNNARWWIDPISVNEPIDVKARVPAEHRSRNPAGHSEVARFCHRLHTVKLQVRAAKGRERHHRDLQPTVAVSRLLFGSRLRLDLDRLSKRPCLRDDQGAGHRVSWKTSRDPSSSTPHKMSFVKAASF
jgi:hypothetical protein